MYIVIASMFAKKKIKPQFRGFSLFQKNIFFNYVHFSISPLEKFSKRYYLNNYDGNLCLKSISSL